MKKIIRTKLAPAPIGPYNQAVVSGNLLFVSGQIALVPATGELMLNNIREETIQVMENLGAVLTAGGSSFKDIVKTSIFLSDMAHFQVVNETYAEYFETDFPARETVQVAGLPRNVNVEISVIAEVSNGDPQ